MKKTVSKYSLVFLAVVALLLFVLYFRFRTNDDTNDDFKTVAWTSHLSAVEKVGDISFTDFVRSDLQDVCPFYEPDGVSYRECLSEYVLKNQRDADIEVACQEFASEYEGIERQNLYLSCLAFFLSHPSI